ncbi:hypothetical protein [Nostoc sp.]|uniref:hypothetical protein n=1 Tax=Nostoc sp. TaxID=1180 RepID=UPI002FF1EE60
MTILNHKNFRSFVKAEYQKLQRPTGQARRRGVEKVVGMPGSGGSLEAVEELLKEGIYNEEEACSNITEAVLELTSFLYSAGAEHQIWRRWSSLTAFGMFLTAEIHQAAQYAVLGGEWEFLKVLPAKPLTSQEVSERVLWTLVISQADPNLPNTETDSEDDAWLHLAKSIPAQDHRNTEAALKTIADFWMEELEGEWINFHLGSYPDFHTPACAVAALARHYGFTPISITPEQYSFLEAGLAISEPSPMFPNIFSLPESSKVSAV